MVHRRRKTANANEAKKLHGSPVGAGACAGTVCSPMTNSSPELEQRR